MTVIRNVTVFHDRFNRAQEFTTTPGHNGWTIADTSAAGDPTYLCESGEGAVLSLANTTEVENVCLFQDDKLQIPLAGIQQFSCDVKVASVGATTVAVFGLGSERNNDEDEVAVNAFLKIEGEDSTSAVVAETDDGVLDNDDVATARTLGSSYKRLRIDFTNGLADVRFYFDGVRVAEGTTFDMSNASATQHVQPMFQLSKGATAGTPQLFVRDVKVQYRESYGS